MRFKHQLVELPEPLVETLSYGRFYTSPDGNRYPSVTTVMGVMDKTGLDEWRARVGEEEANRISKAAADRGTALHTVCENYLLNKEYRRRVMPTTLDLFHKIKPILDDNIEIVYGVETPLTSDYLKVGGRVDAVVRWTGKDSILDFKSANKPKRADWILSYFYQTAIYAVMMEERTGIACPQIVIVMASDSPAPGQVFIKKRDDYIDGAMSVIREYYSKR